MRLLGKTSIHPFLFFTGKICGYAAWVLLALDLTSITSLRLIDTIVLTIPSLLLLFTGIFVIILSLVNLGSSVSLGLPDEETTLQTRGIYRISRNPMYLGFNMLTISSMVLTLNPVVLAMGFYSIIVYHWIILAEEEFLEKRFCADFLAYKEVVRRYI